MLDLCERIEAARPGSRTDPAHMSPNLLVLRRSRARMARSDTGGGVRGTPCNPRSCPRKCNPHPASRSNCSGRQLFARTSPRIARRSHPGSLPVARSRRHQPKHSPELPCSIRTQRVQEKASPSRYQGDVESNTVMVQIRHRGSSSINHHTLAASVSGGNPDQF